MAQFQEEGKYSRLSLDGGMNLKQSRKDDPMHTDLDEKLEIAHLDNLFRDSLKL